MSIIAIRRNLAPGAVFFRQQGQAVEYSLDKTTWELAFILPAEKRTVSPTQWPAIDNLTIEQFITINESSFDGSLTVNNLADVAAGNQLRRNLCTASNLLAAAFVALLNGVKEESGDAETRFLGAGTALAGGALGLFVLLTPVGWIGAGIATLLGYFAAGLGVGGTALAFIAEADNIPDLTADDAALIACYLLKGAQATGADKASMRTALDASYPDLNALPAGVADAWKELWDISPSLYSAWLAGLTDLEATSCSCGGCDEIIPWECTINNQSGYKLLNGGIQSAPTTAAYTPTNYKYLSLSWTPPSVPSGLVDRVELTYATTQYQKSSALNWGTTGIVTVDLIGVNVTATSQAKQITEVAPIVLSNTVNQGGLKTFVFDFSSVSQTGTGLTGMNLNHRLAYAVSGVGADTVFIGGKVCYQGP